MTFCCLDRGFSLSLLLLSAIAISQYGLQCSSSAAFLFFSVSFLLSCAACQCLILNFNSSSLFLSWFLGFTFLLSYINSLQAAGTFLQGATWLLLGFLQLNALAFVLRENFKRDRTKCTLAFNIICSVDLFRSFENELFLLWMIFLRSKTIIRYWSMKYFEVWVCTWFTVDTDSTDSWSLLLPDAMWILPTEFFVGWQVWWPLPRYAAGGLWSNLKEMAIFLGVVRCAAHSRFLKNLCDVW